MQKMSILSMLVVLSLASCSTPQPMQTIVVPPPTSTLTPPTPTSMPMPAMALQIEDGELEIAIIGDFTLEGVGPLYAALVESDLNVKVNLDERIELLLPIASVLERLRTNAYWRAAFAEKDIVVFYGNLAKSVSAVDPFDWMCLSAPFHASDCPPEAFATYREHMSAVIEEIRSLRSGNPTLIIAADGFVPIVGDWKEAGVNDSCMRCWENYSEALHQAAAQQNVPVAHVFDAFHGPKHGEDPRAKGYVVSVGHHTSDIGKQVIADLLHELGYGYNTR